MCFLSEDRSDLAIELHETADETADVTTDETAILIPIKLSSATLRTLFFWLEMVRRPVL